MLEGALLLAAHLLLHTVLCDIILQCAQSLHHICTIRQTLQKVQQLATTDYSHGDVSTAQPKMLCRQSRQ